MEFSSRAVRSLVELHEQELRSFLDVWKRFVASGRPGFPDTYQVLIRCRTDGVALLGFDYVTHDIPTRSDDPDRRAVPN